MTLLVAALTLAAVFLIAYAPDVGHGFIKDDFAWIGGSRVADLRALAGLFTRHVGFYRPIVSVSFAVDHAIWGLNPVGYAATNLVLAVADAALVLALARRFALPWTAALLGAAVWAFNFHGINMALLWISGRTALLVALFALAASLAWLSGKRMTAGILALAAMLCKEEAVMLPVMFSAFALMDPLHDTPRHRGTVDSLDLRRGRLQPALARFAQIGQTAPLWLALAIYLVLRSQSGAFGPTDAPWFYRFSFSPALLVRNVFEYADRAATFAIAVVLVLLAVCRWHRVRLTPGEGRALRFAACWLPAMYALTVLLPIRSSLYALLPSVAAALAAAAIAARAERARPVAFRRAGVALLVVVALLIPVYRARNQRWVSLADLSADVTEILRTRTQGPGAPGFIVLVDDPGERVNLDAAFGSLLPDALALELGPGWSGAIVPAGQPLPEPRALTFRLEGDRLVAEP